MAEEQIRIDIDADASKAYSELDGVADAVDELERATPEVEVTADTDKAERGIKDVRDDAEALSRQDTEILLRARIDDAKAGLKALRDDLDQTGDRARDTAQQLDRVGGDSGGLKTRGNAIADLTGPLGEASGAASDFAGVFDGLGDIAEDVAGKVGLNAAAMGTAIGGIGIAVAGAAALWSVFSERQRKAREEQKKLEDGQRKINDAIREGNTLDAAEQLTEQYGAAFRAAERLGLQIGDVTRYITGQTDSIPGLNGALDDLHRRFDDDSTPTKQRLELQKLIIEFDNLTGSVDGARGSYAETNGTLAEQDQRLRDVAGALGGLTRDTDRAESAQGRLERQADRTRTALEKIEGALDMQQAFLNFQTGMQTALDRVNTGAGNTAQEVLDIKQSIIDVAEAARLTPIEVKSLLEKVDRGDLAGVKADVEGYYARNQAQIETQLRPPTAGEMAAMNRQIRDGIGIVFLTAALNNLRSGVYG